MNTPQKKTKTKMNRIKVNLTQEQLAQLDGAAEKLQCSRAQVMRLLVNLAIGDLAKERTVAALIGPASNQ